MLLKLMNFLIVCGAFVLFLYGVRNLYIKVDRNNCRMTYMFESPQFSRVLFDENKYFSYYRLLYYNEGPVPVNVNKLMLKGAPVVFIHGNAGSFKQVRSLASVAIRKSMDSDRHIKLDYFTLDFGEEMSGLYGGYMLDQEKYLKECIRVVGDLYRRSTGLTKQVFLIGHSMGGKLAQSILRDDDLRSYINGILYISSPVDKPVIYADSILYQYYKRADEFISSRCVDHTPNNETNVCKQALLSDESKKADDGEGDKMENIMMISIGGGNRDVLVQAALTTSRYNDLHAMTSSIPTVWLSCDHLSILWCLQLMLVVNRFLFSITTVDRNRNVYFYEDKWERMKAAQRYFTTTYTPSPQTLHEITSREHHQWDMATGPMDSVTSKIFPRGLNTVYYYIVPKYEKIYVEMYASVRPEWLRACFKVDEQKDKEFVCKAELDLSHLIRSIPTRSVAVVDWNAVMGYREHELSYLMIRLPPTNEKVSINIDRFSNSERGITIQYKDYWWYNRFRSQSYVALDQTNNNTLYYSIRIEDLTEPTSSLHFLLQPETCQEQRFQVVVKVCVPWARGFEEYHKMSDASIDNGFYVSVPYRPPKGYNITRNPVRMELFLDTRCRFKLSYQYSMAGKLSNIILLYYKWLPSHLVSVLLMILRNQCQKQQDRNYPRQRGYKKSDEAEFTSQLMSHSMPLINVFQSSSLYIVISCRIFKGALAYWNWLPEENDFPLTANNALFDAIIIHSSAIVLGMLLECLIWFIVIMHGNLLYKMTFNFPLIAFHHDSPLLQVIKILPLTFGVVFITIAVATCSGVALLLSMVFYVIMISNAYKDYWEDMVWRYSVRLVKKLYHKMRFYWPTSVDLRSLRTPLVSVSARNTSSPLITNAEEDNRSAVLQEEHSEEIRVPGSDFAKCEEGGLQQFAFHITLVLLLLAMSIVNVGLMMAWIKSRRDRRRIIKLPDPELWPTITVISCVSLLLQINAPQSKPRIPKYLFYGCSILCILLCEDYMYYLNEIIAAVFVAITISELLQKYFFRK